MTKAKVARARDKVLGLEAAAAQATGDAAAIGRRKVAGGGVAITDPPEFTLDGVHRGRAGVGDHLGRDAGRDRWVDAAAFQVAGDRRR